MKTWCEQLLAEQYAEDRSKAYYVDESGEWKWYITERGRYSKVDFLAGYKAAKAIVEEELQAVQAQRAESPGLGAAEYALRSVLAKMGGK